MKLSSSLIRKFAQISNDSNKANNSITVCGTVKSSSGYNKTVQIDGSDFVTPVVTGTDAEVGDRVQLTIENHVATLTSNFTAPASSRVATDVVNISTDGDVYVGNLNDGTFYNLKTINADVGTLKVDKADITLANIDTANIDIASIGKMFAKVGLLDRATIVEGHVTGYLASVEVDANKITAGTLIADRILLRGTSSSDASKSVLYQLNAATGVSSPSWTELNGEVIEDRTINADKIVAGSITANEIDVKNLFAQTIEATGTISGAKIITTSGTIGGWTIGTNSIYNGTSSITSTTKGTYIGTDGFRDYNSANSYTNISGGKITSNNVDLSGAITATSGNIGGWTINSNGISYYDKTTTRFVTIRPGDSDRNVLFVRTGSNTDDDPYVIKAMLKADGYFGLGSSSDDGYFRYYPGTDDYSYSGVYVKGDITATSGSIGSFTINKALYNNKTSLTSATTGVYIGSDGISLGANSVFKVTNAGVLTASNATIKGNITADSIIVKEKLTLRQNNADKTILSYYGDLSSSIYGLNIGCNATSTGVSCGFTVYFDGADKIMNMQATSLILCNTKEFNLSGDLYLNRGTYTRNYSIGIYYQENNIEMGGYYSPLCDNGTNLWIGAQSSSSQHHCGGTFISSGFDATYGQGKSTIYVSIPEYDGTTWTATNYPVLHSGNYSSYAATKGSKTNGTATTKTIETATWTLLTSVAVEAGGQFVTANASFPNNSSGQRRIYLTTSNTAPSSLSGAIGELINQTAVSGSATNMSLTKTHRSSSSVTYYLFVYQNSGSSLSVTGSIDKMVI